MDNMSQPIKNANIVRRTFEGKTDPSKNDNPITSKYYTSKKYAVVCEWYGKPHAEAFTSKQEAQDWIDYHSIAREL
jgi:hypothetical protein